MPNDPFYKSPLWERQRAVALARDHYRCTVPNCGARAVVVDHIVSPNNGGSHALHNLRSLCRRHDQMIKERPGRSKRGRGGQVVAMCRTDGMPSDPAHPWARGRG